MFCAQEAQTGKRRAAGKSGLSERLAECRRSLEKRSGDGKLPPELAFYGGTFTALQDEAWEMCLNFARKAVSDNLITGFRCSTRPDKLAPDRLAALVRAGCHTLELGIQSFSDKALLATERGYSGTDCIRACQRAIATGMTVCAHLMPGLPGGSLEDFLTDIEIARLCGLRYLRLSPCLVPRGTKLERMWKNGAYTPWSMAKTLLGLAESINIARDSGMEIIRIGLAPQEELEAVILAGPAHPSLGSRAEALSLLITAAGMKLSYEKETGNDRGMLSLHVPAYCQGHIWGWRGELKPLWRNLGFNEDRIHFWKYPLLCLTPSKG